MSKKLRTLPQPFLWKKIVKKKINKEKKIYNQAVRFIFVRQTRPFTKSSMTATNRGPGQEWI